MPTTGAQAAADVLVVRPPPRTFFFRNPFSSVLVFILVIVSSFCLSGAAVHDHNKEAQPLLQFRNSLQQSNPNVTNQLADWNPSTPPCSGNRGNWFGVLCYNGNVFGLKLENMSLKGPLDVDPLMPLHTLRTLSFMDNNLDGPIPDWRKIGALKSVYLSNNQFSGQILEDAFKGMYSLKKVHIANNKLTGHIPTSLESPKLIELRLEFNQFTGTIPLISSDNLNLLNVSNNLLEGPIPTPLSKMDPTSFGGNKALCGAPLRTWCPMDPNKLRKILIIVVSVILLVAIIAILCVCTRRRRGSQTPQLGREVTPAADIEDAGSNVAAVGADQDGSSAGKTRKSQKQQQSTSAAGKLSFVREDRQRFELQDLMRASAEVLGSGNFGASYKAVLVDGDALVVKRFKQMNIIGKEDFFEHMRRLGRLKHPNLLPLVAYLYRREEKLLVFDYAHNGSLAAQLHGKPQGLNWARRLNIIKGVGKGLVYLQRELPSLTLSHGHLKSSNVLLDKEFNPVLMDYALAPVVNATHVHQILIAYKSPEFAKHGLISKKTDVWCFGILILETLTGKYVAHGTEQVDLVGYINAIVGEQESAKVFDKDMEISCKGEMEKLLQIAITCCQEDPEKRLELEEAVRQIEQLQDSSPN